MIIVDERGDGDCAFPCNIRSSNSSPMCTPSTGEIVEDPFPSMLAKVRNEVRVKVSYVMLGAYSF